MSLPLQLVDQDDRRTWRAREGTLRAARARCTTAAYKAIVQAHSRGLSINIYGTSRTEIIGQLGHKLIISHREPAVGDPRITRFRLADLGGKIIDTLDAAAAAGWIATQPRVTPMP